MTEKQLEFRFAHNKILRVIALGYLGGQDEDLGGYCEPLIIEYLGGMEQYLLHAMYQHREGESDEKIVDNHIKAIFPRKSKLLEAWEECKLHLMINDKLHWEKTNSVCGTESTPEEFYKIKREEALRGLEKAFT